MENNVHRLILINTTQWKQGVLKLNMEEPCRQTDVTADIRDPDDLKKKQKQYKTRVWEAYLGHWHANRQGISQFRPAFLRPQIIFYPGKGHKRRDEPFPLAWGEYLHELATYHSFFIYKEWEFLAVLGHILSFLLTDWITRKPPKRPSCSWQERHFLYFVLFESTQSPVSLHGQTSPSPLLASVN